MLFDGVQQRITIFYARTKCKTQFTKVYSSKLWRWEKEDQEKVVCHPEYVYVDILENGVIPKIGSEIGAEIYRHIKSAPDKLSDLITKNSQDPYVAHYHSVAMYWIKAYDFLPYFKRENETSPSRSSKLKSVYLQNSVNKNIFLLLVNSSLFYFWWIAQGDEFDVLVSEINEFGVHGYDHFLQSKEVIYGLVKELMEDYKKNSIIKSTSLGGSKCHYQEFYPRQSRHIINKIDDFIAPIYGFNEEQNKFLKEYDLTWRTDD